jgi:hypothetical protein
MISWKVYALDRRFALVKGSKISISEQISLKTPRKIFESACLHPNRSKFRFDTGVALIPFVSIRWESNLEIRSFTKLKA